MPESTRSAPEAAKAVGCDVAQIVKSLVFRSVEADEALLVLVSGADRVDESRLGQLVGGAVERASAGIRAEPHRLCHRWSPPLGHVEPILTYLDEHLLDYPLVWAAAGTPRAVFSIAPSDLLKLTSARLVSLAAG